MYAKISNAQEKTADQFAISSGVPFGSIFQNLSFNEISSTVTAGADGATVKSNFFVAPTKSLITKVQAMIEVVNAGADNTPTVALYNFTTSRQIAVSSAIALGGTIGDVVNLTIDPVYDEISEGDVLQIWVVNPTATIDTALQVKVQMEWNSIF